MYNGSAVVNINSLLRRLPTQFPTIYRVPRFTCIVNCPLSIVNLRRSLIKACGDI